MPLTLSVNVTMSEGAVANYLNVTERTIYRLAVAKQIPVFKLGRSWRFSKADIDAWTKKQSEQNEGHGQ